jgi:hypothetical protein
MSLFVCESKAKNLARVRPFYSMIAFHRLSAIKQ